MKLRFWGVRGSIAHHPLEKNFQDKISSVENYVKNNNITDVLSVLKKLKTQKFIGGNTSCVSLEIEEYPEHIFIFDSGTGIKSLGDYIIKKKNILNVHIFISHTHWDHISGFPFFSPLYLSKYNIKLYSLIDNLKERFELQQHEYFFPVSFNEFVADLSFIKIESPIMIGDVSFDFRENNHPGKSWSYKVEYNQKSVVYMTDCELSMHNIVENRGLYNKYLKDADVLIFDAQYTYMDFFVDFSKKSGWGHSSGIVGVDLANEFNINKLVLFHFDPDYTDRDIKENLEKSKKFAKKQEYSKPSSIINSYEGLVLKIY